MWKIISPRWDVSSDWDLARMVHFFLWKQNLYMRMDSSQPGEISPQRSNQSKGCNNQKFPIWKEASQNQSKCFGLYVIIMSRTSFRVNPHSIVCLNVKELLARSRRYIWSLSDGNVIRTHNHLVCKRTLNHLWIHSGTRTWHDKNIQSNAPYM